MSHSDICISVPEAELRNIFNHFGTVQTCIVNREKRHAFVKMLTRKDAVAAKTGTEETRDPDLHLRVSCPIAEIGYFHTNHIARRDGVLASARVTAATTQLV